MNEKELATTLEELTAGLEPAPGTPPDELRRARFALAQALASGQPAGELRGGLRVAAAAVSGAAQAPASASHLAEIAAAARTALSAAGAAPETRAFLRQFPVRSDLDPATPAALRGVRLSASLGPFRDAAGALSWIDLLAPPITFEAVQQVAFVRGPAGSLVASLPVRIAPVADPRLFPLGKGSLWIAAPLLAAGAPAGSLVGLRIRGGTLRLSQDPTGVAPSVTLPPAAHATLTVDLDPPAAPPADTGPGADATEARCNLPVSVTIELAPDGAHVTALPDFSATIFGTEIDLHRGAGSPAPRFDAAIQHVLVPAAAAPARFAIGASRSRLFTPAGADPITAAAWALPVTTSPASPPGEAAGAGAIYLRLDTPAGAAGGSGGVRARWPGLPASVTLTSLVLYLIPGQLTVLAGGRGGTLQQRFLLWDETMRGRSSLDFELASDLSLLFVSAPGAELLLVSGAATAHLDRPLAADGQRFALFAPAAALALAETADGRLVGITGTLRQLAQPLPVPVALQNALLIVSPPENLSLFGSLDSAGGVEAGTLGLLFRLRALRPTLPDPYAALTFGAATDGSDAGGLLFALTRWSAPEQPRLAFQRTGGSAHGELAALLDLSSNADQLGVFLSGSGRTGASGPQGAQIDELTLVAPGTSLAVFTVPEISWEPVRTDSGSTITAPDDGGPSSLRVATTELLPVAPRLLLVSGEPGGPLEPGPFFTAAARHDSLVTGDLTLPFGLRATIEFNAAELVKNGGAFELNGPAFPGRLTGGLQIKLRPSNPDLDNAHFRGHASTVPPDDPPSGYGAEILSDTVAFIFNPEFKETVPLKRYDLSGYGASVFSQWRDPGAKGAAIIKVHFDVLVGRTAYEVVQARSIIYPWAIRVVRTIMLQRHEAGSVLRTDTGWVAASAGAFDIPFAAADVHSGPVPGVINVRNIREIGGRFDVPVSPPGTTFTYEPVLFDADVQLGVAIVSGAAGISAGASRQTACRDLSGYLLLGPPKMEPDPAGVAALLALKGPAAGPVACTVEIDGSGARMKAISVEATAATGPAGPALVSTLRGTPQLPRDGGWSVGRRATAGNQPPEPVDPRAAVPLIQNRTEPKTWHFADPADVLRVAAGSPLAPQHEYGLLQATGTQKLFFARPQLTHNVPRFHLPQPPHLADVGALLNATGLFPGLDAALSFPPGAHDLEVAGDGLKIHRKFTLDPTVARPLVSFGTAVALLLEYNDGGRPAPKPAEAEVTIEPGGWAVTLTNISFPVVTPLGDIKDPLLRVVGTAKASSRQAPTLTDLTVRYGGALAPVQSVFANLQQLAKFLPGGAGANLDVAFSAGKLTIRDSFAIPRLPLGIGYITDVALILGAAIQLSPPALEFTAGIGSELKPFHWLVSPLSGTGVVQVGVRDGDLAVLIQAGIGAGLAIDLAIASGSASIVIALQVDNQRKPLELKAILTGQASVDVLDGAASASLTLSAGLGFTPHPLPPRIEIDHPLDSVTLTASVAVGIHISICWVLHVDFDDYWQFSRDVAVPALSSVVP